MGTHVRKRGRAYLSGPTKKVAPEQWAVCPNAFRPLVSAELFERARKRLANVSYRLSNEQLLERLQSVSAEKGKTHLQGYPRISLVPFCGSVSEQIRWAYECLRFARIQHSSV